MSDANVDLHRGQDQRRHFECGIASLPHRDKLVFGDSVAHIDIRSFLFGHRRFSAGRPRR